MRDKRWGLVAMHENARVCATWDAEQKESVLPLLRRVYGWRKRDEKANRSYRLSTVVGNSARISPPRPFRPRVSPTARHAASLRRLNTGWVWCDVAGTWRRKSEATTALTENPEWIMQLPRLPSDPSCSQISKYRSRARPLDPQHLVNCNIVTRL